MGALNAPHSLPTPPKALPGWLSRWRPWLQADMVPQALPRRSPLLPYPHIHDLHKYSPFMNAQIQANLSWFKIFTSCRSLHPSHHSPPSLSSLTLVSYISVSLLPGYEANALFHNTRILPGSSNVWAENTCFYMLSQQIICVQGWQKSQGEGREGRFTVQDRSSQCDTKLKVAASQAISQVTGVGGGACLERPPIYGALRSKQGQGKNWQTTVSPKWFQLK